MKLKVISKTKAAIKREPKVEGEKRGDGQQIVPIGWGFVLE